MEFDKARKNLLEEIDEDRDDRREDRRRLKEARDAAKPLITKLRKAICEASIRGKEVAWQINLTDIDYALLDRASGNQAMVLGPMLFRRIECFFGEKTELVKRTHYDIEGVCRNCRTHKTVSVPRGLTAESTLNVTECDYCGNTWLFPAWALGEK